ncbi:MAG TPA: acetyl-CoA C-acyltransferase [Rhodoplanes sp.]|nr:acetyl-CoA C-acyltransferase [Rhodoplanes sp.]
MTVNRLCGSGVQAIVSAAQAIKTGDADVALAGGAESMSRGAYWNLSERWGARMGDVRLIDAVVGSLTDPFDVIHMGMTAENLAESHSVSREAQDDFSFESHRRAQAAIDSGKFDDDVVPVQVKAKRETVEFKVDEHVRRDVVRDVFSKLRPAFKEDGTVTAGNAAGVNDAGAAVIVMSSRKAEELGAPVRARILSWAVCGVEPKAMGIGPVPVVRRALERAGKTLEDVDVIELNEVRGSVARTDERPRPRPGEGEPQRRRDRAPAPRAFTNGGVKQPHCRSPDQRDRSDHHREDPLRDGARITSSGSRSASAAARASRCCSDATEPDVRRTTA